jgi:large subunit ribosomal protein L15
MEELYLFKKPEYIKRRKRVGRGNSSGHGSQSGKGHDGQLSRAGKKHRPWFEGGQMPLQRRVPKRGFHNYTKQSYQIINVSLFDKLGAGELTPEIMKKEGYITHADRLVKVLGNGEITKPARVTADAFSKKAIGKIKKAGGEAIVRDLTVKKQADN